MYDDKSTIVETWSLRTGVSSVDMECGTVSLIKRPCLSPHFITRDEYAALGDTTGVVADALRSAHTEGIYPRDHSSFAALAWSSDYDSLDQGLAPSPTLLWEVAVDRVEDSETTVLLPMAVKAPSALPIACYKITTSAEVRDYINRVDAIWESHARKVSNPAPEVQQAQALMASWSWLLMYAEERGMSVACSGALLAMDGADSLATLVVRASPQVIAGLYVKGVLKSLSDEDKPE